MKKILIAGTSSGVGKTTISIGIMRALSNRGLNVAPYKVGPDYIDTSYHEFATNNKSRNLDTFMLKEDIVKYLFNKNSKDADISIIEGVMGLYDGYEPDINSCTSSYISKLLKTPVILVIDAKSMATSAAAMVLGYKNLDENVQIKGIIANNISSQSHFDMVKKSIEKYTGIQVIGYVPKHLEFCMPSRHLGLVPAIEMDKLDEKINDLAKIIEKHIDIDALVELSNSEDVHSDFKIDMPKFENKTMAIAYDKAFNFYYWDNLDLIKELGINIKYFSPLNDESLPECDAVYIGGGFPEMFAKQLEMNNSMRCSIKDAHDKNIPIYAECGGLMYLGNEIEDLDGNYYNMVGILNGKSVMSKSLKRFGYCIGIANESTIICKNKDKILGHEFHHSDFISEEKCVFDMVKIKENKVLKSWSGGYSINNTLGTYLHIHFYSDLNIVQNIMQRADDR